MVSQKPTVKQTLQSLKRRIYQVVKACFKRLDWLAEQLSTFRKILTNIIILMLGLLFLLIAYQEFTTDYVLIEPFEIPESLQKQGYTGRVMANKLIDEINTIKTIAKSKINSKMFIPVWTQTLGEIKVPESDLSLNTALQYIKTVFGREPTCIYGEVTIVNNQLYVTTRISDKPAKTVLGDLENINIILRQSAEHIYEYIQPYILAAYFYDNDKTACKNMIKYILANESLEDNAWAYNLRGNILSEEHDYQGAIAQYQKAIEEANTYNPKFAAPYNGWGIVLFKQKNYKEAITKFEKAIQLDSKYSEAYSNWGVALMEQKEYMLAINKFQKAIELDPDCAEAYFNWGVTLYKQGENKPAITKFEKAFELDPDGKIGEKAKQLLNQLKQIEQIK